MKLFIVFVLVTVVSAKPSGIASPLVYSAPVTVAAPVAVSSLVATQYHSQDELGQYSYGYSNAQSAKAEARSANGLTIGGYTYVDPEGKLQSVEYSSDINGFRVAASNLPLPPAVPAAPVLPIPLPVQDTPEVVEARAKHLETFETVKLRSTEVIAPLPAVSTIVKSISPVVATAPIVAATPVSAPLLAAKSAIAIPTELVQPSTEPSTEAPTTAAVTEVISASVPEVQTKSATTSSIDSTVVTPAGVSFLSTPTLGVRSFVAPTLPVRIGPVVSAPVAYSINSLHPYGFTSMVAQPAITSYTAQFLAPVPGSAAKISEAWAPEKKTEQSTE